MPKTVHNPDFEVVNSLPNGELTRLSRAGRPLKVNEARFNRVVDRIRNGLTIVSAVREEGFTYQAFRRKLRERPEWQAQVDEAEVIREEQWKGEAMQTFRNATLEDWRAARDYLERRFPSDWALRTVVRATATNDANFAELTREQLLEAIEVAQRVALEAPKGFEPKALNE